MSNAYPTYPKLSGEQLEKLQSLERELGTVIVAVKPQATVAELSPDKLRRLQEAEREMGVVLLAYRQV